MGEYDEDLSVNSWFLALTHVYSNLFVQATNERWMICIPRVGSWRGGNESTKSFNASVFESHCIRFSGTAIIQKKDDCEARKQEVHINKYVTYNGKTVLIDGSKIVCGSGFVERVTSFDKRSEQLELPADGVNHYAQVLFEETYFNSKDQSYKMLCLSRPLELDFVSEKKIDHVSEGIHFSPGVQGYHLWERASNSEKLKHNIDMRINVFIKQHSQGTTSNSHILTSMDGKESLKMEEMDNIKACVNAVQSLFDNCVQVALKDSKIKKEKDDISAVNTLKRAIERYALHEIYGSVFRQISSFVATQEASFNKTAQNMSSIRLCDLGVDKKYWLSLPQAKRKLSRINKCCTPHDKFSCLQQTVLCITTQRDTESVLGSDDLLPIFVYLVIKSNIPNWITNLIFLQHFQLMPATREQHNFYLTTLEAAIEHIKQEAAADKILLIENDLPRSDGAGVSSIEEFFLDCQSGNLSNIKDILSKSAKSQKILEQKMCHPLCACNECTNLKHRTANKSSEITITVRTRTDKGQTALHIASSAGQHEIVDLLVEYGAELNAADYHNSTPLHIAALFGSQSVVFLLLHHGANANATDNNNNTPLHLCCQRGHEACVKAFLYFDPSSSVVNVNASNDEGDTPLHIASRWGYEGIVSALIECGANAKALNKQRQSVVDVSHNTRVLNTIKIASNQVLKLVKTLKHLQPFEKKSKTLQEKKEAGQKKTRLRTVDSKELQDTTDNVYVAKQIDKLFRAIGDNDINMVKFLCGWQSTEDNNKLEDCQETTCHPLCQCTKCQPLSHEHVLHVNSCNQEKYTALMIAARNGFFDMVKLFLEHHASVNARTKKHNQSALHFACEKGHANVAEVILSQEGSISDIRDVFGNTPLYMSSIYNYPECVTVLLKYGASVNTRNRDGNTPIHVAVKWQNTEVIRLLLDHEALVYYKNNDGDTPLDLANKNPKIQNLLLSAIKSNEGSAHASEFSISPHSVQSQTQPLHPSSGGFTCHAMENNLHDSISTNDEAIADDLYTKFKEPTPPTPPPIHLNKSSFDYINGDEKCHDLVPPIDNEDLHDRLSNDARESIPFPTEEDDEDMTSDIFRDLLPADPTSMSVTETSLENFSETTESQLSESVQTWTEESQKCIEDKKLKSSIDGCGFEDGSSDNQVEEISEKMETSESCNEREEGGDDPDNDETYFEMR